MKKLEYLWSCWPALQPSHSSDHTGAWFYISPHLNYGWSHSPPYLQLWNKLSQSNSRLWLRGNRYLFLSHCLPHIVRAFQPWRMAHQKRAGAFHFLWYRCIISLDEKMLSVNVANAFFLCWQLPREASMLWWLDQGWCSCLMAYSSKWMSSSSGKDTKEWGRQLFQVNQ